MIAYMVARRTGRLLAAVALATGLAAGALAGCSGEGSTASCSTSQCTVTFERSVDKANIKILGVQVELVSATADTVTIKVSDQEVTLNKGESVKVGDFQVKVQSITDSQVVVEVSKAQ